jgi:hypothetical protein
MEQDPEMLAAFEEEILMIKNELQPLVATLKTQYDKGELFEKFGQVIDRIYGTASTMGFMEMASYCRAVKSISYKCSQSDNMYAKGKVKDICVNAFGYLEKFSKVIKNPSEIRKIQYAMKKECDTAAQLEKTLFADIQRGSTKG